MTARIAMRGTRRVALREAGPAAALVLFILGAEAFAYGRLSPLSWREPLAYGGDSWVFLAGVKAARDGHVSPFSPIEIPELNAPFTASWNDFPNRQPSLLWIAGILARPLGLFAASNLFVLLAPVLSGLAFYAVARGLRVLREWAWVCACAFALSPFFFYRAAQHVSLALYAHVPLCLLVAGWAMRRCGLVARRRFYVALGVAVVAGLGNFYYAALFVQLLLGASLIHLWRRSGRRAVARPLLLALATMVFVAAENAYFLRYQWTHGRNPGAVTRSYGDVERYALKPIELVVPWPGHGLFAWGSLFPAYWSQALVRGEQGSAYLGLVGGVALLALLGSPLARALLRKRERLSPAFLAAAWILAFSVVGGVNGLLSLVVPPWLRATNRFSIVLLAIALLFAAHRLSRAPFLQSPPRRRLAALALLALVFADQTKGASVEEWLHDPAADEGFVREVEAALPAGASLFMLPVQPFPEWPRQNRMRDYEHFRPYLHSRRLRFSYGTDRGRVQEEWQNAVASQEPAAMIASLERFGFAGVLLNREAYTDEGGALLEGLRAAGREARLERDDLVFVPLRPWPKPELPAPSAEKPSPPPETR